MPTLPFQGEKIEGEQRETLSSAGRVKFGGFGAEIPGLGGAVQPGLGSARGVWGV